MNITKYINIIRKIFRTKKNFIFIHINKTGGTSIENALGLPNEHKTAIEKIDEIGYDLWEKSFSFTVIRNPWDKVVSHYLWRVKTNQTQLGTNSIEFNEWVRLAYGEKDPFYYDQPRMFMQQIEWITDNNGEILVDSIYRFENLQADFKKICKQIGKNVTLPHLKATKRDHYRAYYKDSTIEIIADCFHKDIELFDYTY